MWWILEMPLRSPSGGGLLPPAAGKLPADNLELSTPSGTAPLQKSFLEHPQPMRNQR